MFKINKIIEHKNISSFLEKRWLLKQYKKSKNFVIEWIYWKTDLKFRKPKEDGFISFRVNKQFRAFWFLDDDWTFIVYKIDNHQNY